MLLIDRCRRNGDSRQIELLADRMFGLDELSEEAMRAKMEARAFAGDRVGALKIFEGWKEKLAEELGAAPSDLVEGMADAAAAAGMGARPARRDSVVPTGQWKGRPFIGRTAEYRVLYEAWEGLRKGDAGARLRPWRLGNRQDHAGAAADHRRGARGRSRSAGCNATISSVTSPTPRLAVSSTGCWTVPAWPRRHPKRWRRSAGPYPRCGAGFPVSPSRFDSQGETARIRLTEAFHEMLTTIVEEHPVILVVDDLHLADEASLAVLHLVMRRARGQTIMVVLIARPGELVHSPQAARLRESGESLGICEVELAPLSLEESGDLLTALVPSDERQPSASTRRALLRAAGGFPMVLELLTQDWQANGDQSLALAVDAMTAELDGVTGPTVSYRHIIARILRTLDPQTHNVLNLASVLGHRLNDLPMYGVIDLSFGQTMAGLSELSELRVLRDGSHGLEFVNELIRASAYASVPPSLRRALHSSVVDRLLNDPRKRDLASGLEIAWHCIRAGREGEATPHLLSGARDAIRNGAPDVAEHALSSALPWLVEPEATEARFLLVEVLQEQGRWMESLDRLSEIEEADSRERRERFLVYSALAKHNLGNSRSQEMLRRLPAIVALARDCPDIGIRVRAARVGALIAALDPDWSIAYALLTIVDGIPDSELDPDSMGRLVLAKSMLLYQIGRTSESWVLASSGVEELRKRGAANLVMIQLQVGLGSIKSREGQYEEASKCYETAFQMALRLGNDTQLSTVAGNLALCAGRLGRYEKQLEYAGKISRVGSEFQGYVEVQKAYATGFAHAFRGRRTETFRAISELEERLVGPVPAWMLQAWSLWKADLLLILGRKQEAFSGINQAFIHYEHRLLMRAFAGPFARWIALTAITSDEKGRARKILDGLAGDLGSYDFLDQVEILCALKYLSHSGPPDGPDVEEALKQRLDLISSTLKGQLAALEILPR